MIKKSLNVSLPVCGVLILSMVFHAHAGELTDYRNQLTLFSLAKDGPLVDGKLDDACWTDAHVQKATGFVLLMDAGKTEPASVDTEIISSYDDENIYFGITAHEPAMEELKVHSSSQPWMGDCIEVFVGPAGAGQSYFHFIVDTAENTYSGFSESGQEQAATLEWSVKCGNSKSSWTVEMAIPFASLGCEKPKDNQRWDFNVARERYVQPENSSWATLGEFTQRHRFGRLAFYSRHEIAADIKYWENSDADPLMRRSEVSGIKIGDKYLSENADRKIAQDLWSYLPFEAERGEKHANGGYYGQGGLLNAETNAKYPRFYKAATGINRLLMAKSFLDEKLRTAKRVYRYRDRIERASDRNGDSGDGGPAKLQNDSGAIDMRLNELFKLYGRAFDADRSVDQLSGLDSNLTAIAQDIQRLESAIADSVAKAISSVADRTGPWKETILQLPAEQRYLNDDGVNRRYQFTAFHGAHKEPLWPLGPFNGYHIDWPVPWPESDTPGEFEFPKLRGYIEQIVKESDGRIESFSCTEPSFNGRRFPMTQWMLEKAGDDPDIILQTVRNEQAPLVADRVIGARSELNPHHPAALEYIKGYLTGVAAELSSLTKIDYFITTWEGAAFHVGYNASSQSAFRDYLEERYTSIERLNHKWQTDHASFDAIELPYDQYTSPARDVSGLTYEFERWGRLNYARLMAKMRNFLREGAPRVPVMPDPSHFLTEGNGYLMYRENACDIMSFHSHPGLEEPLWVYLNTMNRAFGKITGYFENYYGMWRRAHLDDERLAKRDLYKFFFNLFLRDVRVSTWWLGYFSHATSYVVGYNNNSFRLEYDQTIYRWSATSLPVMFTRCRSIEKALLESHQEIPKTAIIQPCATVFNLASMDHTDNNSDTLSLMYDLHNKLLGPANIAHDYLPEEMVLDGLSSLEDYSVLFLPYAPYMSEEFSRRLRGWVEKGGTLVAIGPFALKNEFGHDLVGGDSIFRTLFPDYRKLGADIWEYNVDGTDKKGRPAVDTKRLGKGRVVCLNRMVDVFLRSALLKGLLTETVKDLCEQSAVSPNPNLAILVREGNHGGKYLGLCNRNVEEPIDTSVRVAGRYENPTDVLVPGGCPVPSEIKESETILEVFLEPGDWTLIRL
jgi:hypothetical protein